MGFLSKIAGWFTGGGKTVERVTDLADEAFHTDQEKAEQDSKDTADARAMTTHSYGTWWDVFIDGWNRAIRPGVTTWLVGGWAGWWKLPSPDTIDPFWAQTTLLVLTFWFGGRALLKDLPSAISAIMAVRRR